MITSTTFRAKQSSTRSLPSSCRRRSAKGLKIIGKDGIPNAYPGYCCVCRTPVEAFGGELVREGRRVAVVCPSCRMGGVVAVAVRRGVEA